MDLGSTLKIKRNLINEASGTSMTATKDMTQELTDDPDKPKTQERPNAKLSGIPGLGQLSIDQIISPSFRSYNQYNPDQNSPKKPFSIKRRAAVETSGNGLLNQGNQREIIMGPTPRPSLEYTIEEVADTTGSAQDDSAERSHSPGTNSMRAKFGRK